MDERRHEQLHEELIVLSERVRTLVEDEEYEHTNHWPTVFETLTRLDTQMKFLMWAVGLIGAGVVGGLVRLLLGA